MTDIEIPLGPRTTAYRALEMLPGILSYFILLLPALLSIWSPFWAAVFVIVYIIAWTVKALGMALRTVQGYQTMRRAQQIDWADRLQDLQDPSAALGRPHKKGWQSDLHLRHLTDLAATVNARRPSDVYHAVIIAAYNESREVIEPTIKSLLASDYDMGRVMVMLAYEERGGATIEATCKDLAAQYGSEFMTMQAIKHPDGMPHEVKGKGGNITYAGRHLQTWLTQHDMNPEHVIVTTLDSDNRPHTQYLSYVAYEFIVHPEPRYVAFQPLALFLNNIWDVPAPMRVVATGNSFWNIINSLRPHMLRNFASHSQSMAALIDMDFWSTRTIVEDGHHFWRSYFRYDGRYDVVPIFVPIYQDAVLSSTYRKTLKAQFVQLRRWAYGASDIPYVATKAFGRDRTVPLWDGISKFSRLLESHVSWASSSLVLLLGAWAPLFLNPESNRSIIAHELPIIASDLQRFAMVGMFITVFLTFRLLPPRPERYKRRRSVWMLAQWVFMPITSIAYGSLAAYNAQTHLLLGKYLEVFDVTDKTVVREDSSKVTGEEETAAKQ